MSNKGILSIEEKRVSDYLLSAEKFDKTFLTELKMYRSRRSKNTRCCTINDVEVSQSFIACFFNMKASAVCKKISRLEKNTSCGFVSVSEFMDKMFKYTIRKYKQNLKTKNNEKSIRNPNPRTKHYNILNEKGLCTPEMRNIFSTHVANKKITTPEGLVVLVNEFADAGGKLDGRLHIVNKDTGVPLCDDFKRNTLEGRRKYATEYQNFYRNHKKDPSKTQYMRK